MTQKSASEVQFGGSHYKDMGDFQPWDVLAKWFTPEEYRGYQKGVAIAYLARERSKGGDLDIKKAIHHLQRLDEEISKSSTELKFPPLEPDALNRGPWLKATHGSVRHEIDKAPFRWTHVLVELWDGERTACPLAQYQWAPDQHQFRMFREAPAK